MRFTKKPVRLEAYYEPYWENGQWVFERELKRPENTLNVGSTQHKECDQICVKLYESYGVVCGMRLKTPDKKKGNKVYEYQEFENMCYLEYANCVSATKRLYWFPVKKGNCTEDITEFPTSATDIVSRKILWEKKLLL
ncbi:uncharacterized protein LOC124541932 [Vanessa cardui]|uniref:uncharacterized protein LOC124541932 n=1 Tax=Vanessa cardui TaxID=171605 RepID=UPI001F12BBB6|nr:uncharacterized protein LOC124541932 [Vanessa cardui]